jgi:hypothetical protein
MDYYLNQKSMMMDLRTLFNSLVLALYRAHGDATVQCLDAIGTTHITSSSCAHKYVLIGTYEPTIVDDVAMHAD